jgi:hypothetical protein
MVYLRQVFLSRQGVGRITRALLARARRIRFEPSSGAGPAHVVPKDAGLPLPA